jgi:hypothetical protein
MVIKCCYGCVAPKRHPGCHATCPDYFRDNEKHQAEKEAERKIKQTQDSVYQQRAESIGKALKRRR